MPVSFDQVPAQWRMPLYWVEIDESMAGLPIIRQPALLVGCMIPATPTPPAGVIAGTGVVNVPKPIGTQAQADKEFGQGSELALMFAAFFANNFAHEVWAGPVAPPVGSTASTGAITITAPPTAAGMLHLYIAGHHVDNIVLGTTDTVGSIAALIADCINDDTSLPVIATVAAGVVTVKCKTPGINGNDITVQLNYYGKIGGQETPPGLGITLPATGLLTGGAGVPDYDTLISALGEHEYEYVALSSTDSNSLFDWEQEWGFEDSGRWGWMRQLYGMMFAAKRDDYSDLILFGETRNGPNLSILGIEPLAPTPPYEWAAAYCAKAARAFTNDPARPLQTLTLNRCLPAQPHDRFILPELNSLSGVGIATQRSGNDHVPRIMRETTTYQLNKYSQSDDSYELCTTMATLAAVIRNQRHVITSKYPRHKLANDETRFGAGQKIVTPKIVKAELVAQYRIDEFNGLVEDVRAFKEHLIVERDPNNPNRLNTLFPPDLINQLRIFAVVNQFRLQYSRGQDAEVLR